MEERLHDVLEWGNSPEAVIREAQKISVRSIPGQPIPRIGQMESKEKYQAMHIGNRDCSRHRDSVRFVAQGDGPVSGRAGTGPEATYRRIRDPIHDHH